MKELRLQVICENEEEVKNVEKEFLKFKRRLSHGLDKKISHEVIILNKAKGQYKMIVSRD